jgi:tyrosyl-tRNA synthetase
MQVKSEFLNTIVERGYLHQCTDLEGLDKLFLDGPVTAYVGIDCTGPSPHVGHMVGIMMLRRLQQTGHRPIAVMGGGTTRIGDPSGKDESRQMLTEDQIEANKRSIQEAVSRFIRFGDGPSDAFVVDNAEWLLGLKYVDFLREYGPHFTINRMMTFDSVKLRLEREQPLTFLEFNYMIFQAYDFVELYRRHGCRLQMGGSDQWGNIVNGVELGRRKENASLFGLTTPLITTASGAKMGKTAQGAVWLREDMLPAYDYWQFWRNTADADVGRFLKLFTDLPLDEIRRLETLEGQEINEAKIILANEATAMCHGPEAAASAADTARQTFTEGTAGGDLPTVAVARTRLDDGMPLIDLMVEAGLAASRGEVRRLIRGGGAKVNDVAVTDEAATISAADLTERGDIKLSAGKKRHALVKPE